MLNKLQNKELEVVCLASYKRYQSPAVFSNHCGGSV